MLAKPVRKDEQIKLIMECRQSGLSDFEWCQQHNINVGTFYNWISRLRRSDGIDVPKSLCPGKHPACKQEVVKVELNHTLSHFSSINDEYNTRIANIPSHDFHNTKVMQIHLPVGSVDVPNGTDPAILEATLRILGGLYAR